MDSHGFTETAMPDPVAGSEYTVLTACPHDCPDACSIVARVKDGRLLGVAGNPLNPYTAGNLCRKVAHYEERVYSPDRVLYPLKRVGARGAGEWRRFTWDEALNEIVLRWQEIIRRYGSEAILPYSYAGTMGLVNMDACTGRLWNRMASSRLARTICSTAAQTGYGYVYGASGGADPKDFVNSQFIICWGANLASTTVHMMPIVREAQRRGATFVVIDPFRTRTANAADWYIAPRPGTDAALALGMANVIFAKGLHDEAFLRERTVGWIEFRDRCASFTPDRVADITGIAAEEIVKLAVAYATQLPSAIRLGYGISRTSHGGSIIRAISTLPAVIGAWGHSGGGLLLSTSSHFKFNSAELWRPDLRVSPQDMSAVHWNRDTPRTINMNQIGDALLDLQDPPIMSMFVFNSNPAAVAPDSARVRKGLMRDDLFLVVHEQMMTDTANLADIVLPATSQLECLDIMRSYGHLYVNLCTPAIPPLGESRANIDVQNALAHAMGFTDSAFDQDAEAIIRAALQSDSPLMQGITYERLQMEGFVRLNTEETPWVPYKAGHDFATKSGRVELYSAAAEKDGYDPLPDYYPPAESRDGDPELASRYPINLLSPAAHHFLNSTFSNIDSLRKSEREPRIWLSPKDCEERSIEDGMSVRVWNDRGEVILAAVVSDRVKPGVAWSPSLWWHRDSPHGANVNVLTSQRVTDMGGGSTFHTNLIQVAAATHVMDS